MRLRSFPREFTLKALALSRAKELRVALATFDFGAVARFLDRKADPLAEIAQATSLAEAREVIAQAEKARLLREALNRLYMLHITGEDAAPDAA